MGLSREIKFKRILLKLSGESLAGDAKIGISVSHLKYFSQEVKSVFDLGVQVAIVIGGGNIFRGISSDDFNIARDEADKMGMLATVINALALKSAFEKENLPARVLSSIPVGTFVEPFSNESAIQHLNAGRIVILAGGTGNPYFTTDTAGVLRAIEIDAEAILKGTRVDGVYNADPEKFEDAILFDHLTYMEVVQRKLKVMDITAITLAMENQLPIIVFNFNKSGNLKKVVMGEPVGTKVQG
ncbi:MAG: UMP kinase [Caldisericaceae bacterium]|nr:UMP kinase [Caldisericaceae bacterium]